MTNDRIERETLIDAPGFAALDLPAESRETRFADHATGWDKELGHLVEHAGRVAM